MPVALCFFLPGTRRLLFLFYRRAKEFSKRMPGSPDLLTSEGAPKVGYRRWVYTAFNYGWAQESRAGFLPATPVR